MPVRRLLALTFIAVFVGVLGASDRVYAQEAAYLDAVAEHYGVARDEVEILSGWGLAPGEIPAVLHVARTAGVSRDAVMALRRGGRSWGDLAARYGLSAARMHVALPDDADAGVLSRIYGEYRSLPSTQWVSLELRDDEVVNLINLRFLSDYLRVAPAQVVQALTSAGSAPAAFARLRGR